VLGWDHYSLFTLKDITNYLVELSALGMDDREVNAVSLHADSSYPYEAWRVKGISDSCILYWHGWVSLNYY